MFGAVISLLKPDAWAEYYGQSSEFMPLVKKAALYLLWKTFGAPNSAKLF